MQRLITITLLGLAASVQSGFASKAPLVPPVPGLPANTDPTTTNTAKTSLAPTTGPLLIDNYLPPVMQALAYYVELLQYEPVHTTTLEPPFEGIEKDGGTTYTAPPKTTPLPGSATTTTMKPWWQMSSTTTAKPPISSKPTSTIWWKPPSTTTTPWWQTTKTTTKKTQTWAPPSNPTFSTTIIPEQHATKPTSVIPWWHTTTKKPGQSTQFTTTSPWWQSTTAKPTPYHRPAIFAPVPQVYSNKPSKPPKSSTKPSTKPTYSTKPPTPSRYTSKPSIQGDINSNALESTTKKNKEQTTSQTDTSFPSLTSDKNFFDWFFQPKAKKIEPTTEYNLQLLDILPRTLLQDILSERYELPALLDKDNVNEFLRIYDDFYGRYRPISGKKRVPPTKPYVEFLMLYDLLKRDAKAMNLSKYEGYSEKMLNELAEISKRSAERQLHTLMTRMLIREEVTKSDVLVRVKSIIKDLENPHSVTSMALRVIPPLQFVP